MYGHTRFNCSIHTELNSLLKVFAFQSYFPFKQDHIESDKYIYNLRDSLRAIPVKFI